MALMLAFGFGVTLGLATMYAICDLGLAAPEREDRSAGRTPCSDTAATRCPEAARQRDSDACRYLTSPGPPTYKMMKSSTDKSAT